MKIGKGNKRIHLTNHRTKEEHHEEEEKEEEEAATERKEQIALEM